MPIVYFLRQFSEKKNATPAQISLAWLLAQKPFIVPIPGTRSADHLHENLRAIDVQLTPADLREIETALSSFDSTLLAGASLAAEKYSMGNSRSRSPRQSPMSNRTSLTFGAPNSGWAGEPTCSSFARNMPEASARHRDARIFLRRR
jgi:Aldo/keto reductase family